LPKLFTEKTGLAKMNAGNPMDVGSATTPLTGRAGRTHVNIAGTLKMMTAGSTAGLILVRKPVGVTGEPVTTAGKLKNGHVNGNAPQLKNVITATGTWTGKTGKIHANTCGTMT